MGIRNPLHLKSLNTEISLEQRNEATLNLVNTRMGECLATPHVLSTIDTAMTHGLTGRLYFSMNEF